MAELERIDRLRYEEAGNFFDRHACLQQFEQQWELAELYKRLLYLTMYHSGTLSERYDKFKKYLLADGHMNMSVRCTQNCIHQTGRY